MLGFRAERGGALAWCETLVLKQMRKPANVAATRRRLGRLLASVGHGTGEPEVGEHAAVGKKRDLGDLAAGRHRGLLHPVQSSILSIVNRGKEPALLGERAPCDATTSPA